MAECAYRGVDCFGASVKCLEEPTIFIERNQWVDGVGNVVSQLESCRWHSNVVGREEVDRESQR